jgi:hypothetical protein
MAKTRTASKTKTIVRYMPPPRPITRRAPARAAKHHHKKHHRGHGRGSSEKVLMGLAVGGLILGYLDKTGSTISIPTVPVLGKAGTIAVVAHLFGKGRAGLVTQIRDAAAVVAAYEFGKEGKVSGDGVPARPAMHARA